MDRFRIVVARGADAAARTQLKTQNSKLKTFLAIRSLPRRQRSTSRLVSIVASALARRQRCGAVQDRVDAWVPSGRRSRENFQEQTVSGRIRKTADRRGVREE